MQNSYSDNRRHGVSYYFVRVLLARAHEPPRGQRIYNIFCLFRFAMSFSAPQSYLCSSIRCRNYALLHLTLNSNHHSRFRCLGEFCSYLVYRLIFRQPPLLIVISIFLCFITAPTWIFFLFFSTGIFGFSCRRVWALPYLPYKSRHSDFFFCFIFFSGDFLFICRTRS